MTDPEERRRFALESVLRLRGVDLEFDPDEVVEEAAIFESYMQHGDKKHD